MPERAHVRRGEEGRERRVRLADRVLLGVVAQQVTVREEDPGHASTLPRRRGRASPAEGPGDEREGRAAPAAVRRSPPAQAHQHVIAEVTQQGLPRRPSVDRLQHPEQRLQPGDHEVEVRRRPEQRQRLGDAPPGRPPRTRARSRAASSTRWRRPSVRQDRRRLEPDRPSVERPPATDRAPRTSPPRRGTSG